MTNFQDMLDLYIKESRELWAAIVEKTDLVHKKWFVVQAGDRLFYGAFITYGKDYVEFLTTTNQTVIIPLNKINYVTRK